MAKEGEYAWLAYLQFLDSALPVGGFSHSFGLESMVQDGCVRNAQELESYIRGMLRHVWATSDAAGVRAMYTYGLAGEWDNLWLADRMLVVQRASADSRDGMLKMGRRLHKLAKTLYPELGWEVLDDAVGRGEALGAYPVVHGFVSAELGIPQTMALEGFLYACICGCVNAGLRLISMGQSEGQRLIAVLLPAARAALLDAERFGPLDMHVNAPLAEIAAMRHRTLYSRLFMS